jgi:hypothetical protein
MNSRFTELLEIEELWPPPEVPLPFQNRFWRETIDSNEQGKTAILYIDALRYELSHQLMESLDRDEAGQNRELSARLASIPTITPICMASLLPHGEDLTISYEDGWELSIGESRNLGDKGNRIKWLKEQLPKVTYLNLDEFITTPNNSIEIEKTIIIFDTTLDAVGENARQFSWTIFSELLKSITQAIHKLLNLGIDNIHVVTDHGFLLIEELGEHEKVKVKTSDALAVKPRYVIGNNLGRTDQLNYKLPKSKNLRVWFPHGIGCFRTPGPYSYVHGGLSLQELIVPQITITRQIIGNIVTIKAEVPKFINSAQFKIHVEAKESKMFDQPRQITIDLLKEKEKIIPTLSQVIKPGENYHLDILLPMGCGLQPNDEITWLIRDAYTEEILLKETAISKIDLW